MIIKARGGAASTDVNKTLAAQSDVTGTTTPQATNLTFAVLSGEIWIARFKGTVQVTASAGFRPMWDGPAGSIEAWYVSSGAALTNVVRNRQTVIGTAPTNATINTLPGEMEFWARMKFTADGTVTFKHAPGNSAQTSSIFAGATLQACKATEV